MKGLVFTEFLDMVENKYGLEVLDKLITQSNLPSEGVYTSIGTYEFSEMQSLIGNLSALVDTPVQNLLYEYGLFFFDSLTRYHPDVFKRYDDPIEMLSSVENHIHVEVRKIYPQAELPTFRIINREEGSLEMNYYSERGMYMFAKALMEKTFEFYNYSPQIDFVKVKKDGTEVKFLISGEYAG